jgi:hypothetical protein
MSVLKQGYWLLGAALLTTGFLLFIGIGLEILVLFGLADLLVVIGILAVFFLGVMLIVGLPFLLAKIALWPAKWPSYDEPSMRQEAHTVTASDASVADAEDWIFPLTVPRALVYLAMVTSMLVLGFLFFQHAMPGAILDVQLYTTFGAEVTFFAALFTYILIKRRCAASRSS